MCSAPKLFQNTGSFEFLLKTLKCSIDGLVFFYVDYNHLFLKLRDANLNKTLLYTNNRFHEYNGDDLQILRTKIGNIDGFAACSYERNRSLAITTF